ncbi:hypothetical protein L226DRAFT_595911, partial [Lentinus tigrinus ALCF2SS1-7]|uniref:uncharacterized protein n=1 Tax=Lentinus tigrinus ALCF2SS1-7 TaxID=1328758 RepID=UPI001165F2A2
LLDLNSDILIQIFEESRPNQQLRALSQSCRYVRTLSLPVLFRKCRTITWKPMKSVFLPTSLWPYVQSLQLVDGCPSKSREEHRSRTDPYVYSLRYSNDPLLCGLLDAEVLRRSLPAMPRLKSISVRLECREVHGIRDDVAAALLSVPQVCDVHIYLYLFCPRQPFPRDALQDMPPLTSFRYEKNPFHYPPRVHPSEAETIGLIVSQLHATLEVLNLPIEATPLDVMSRLDWPHLRHLTLYGDRPTRTSVPIIAVLSRMPMLRILILQLTILPNMDRQCVWPPTWHMADPLPELEELTVTHPHPEDLLFSNLPRTIRRLSLSCAPRYSLQTWHPDDYSRWMSPLPSASELLGIMSKSSLPHLAFLDIEYGPDTNEARLLEYISDAYPHLRSIELHRIEVPLIGPQDTAMVSANFIHL